VGCDSSLGLSLPALHDYNNQEHDHPGHSQAEANPGSYKPECSAKARSSARKDGPSSIGQKVAKRVSSPGKLERQITAEMAAAAEKTVRGNTDSFWTDCTQSPQPPGPGLLLMALDPLFQLGPERRYTQPGA